MHPDRDLRTLARSTTAECRRAADPDASSSSLVDRSTHPGRPRRYGAWAPRPDAPPIGASGARARTAAWARASARSAALSQHGSPRAGRGQNRRAFPGIPCASEPEGPPGSPQARGGMSTPRAFEPRPHRRAPRSRARRRHAIGESPMRNRKLWGDLGISLSISAVVHGFIHTCCTAPNRPFSAGRRGARRYRAKSVS